MIITLSNGEDYITINKINYVNYGKMQTLVYYDNYGKDECVLYSGCLGIDEIIIELNELFSKR